MSTYVKFPRHLNPAPITIQPGMNVMLKTKVVRTPVPQGRQDNRSAIVESINEEGACRLRRDLNGMRWWHVSDLQPTRTTGQRYGCKGWRKP